MGVNIRIIIVLALFILYFIRCTCVLASSAPLPKNIDEIYPSMKSTLPPISAATTSPTVAQSVDFDKCYKSFKLNRQKLFYLTLASVNANKFTINEMQSKSGYVLFTVAQKQYLAHVIKVDAQTSMLKITPCNNNYYFPIGIVQNMFKYVELNATTTVEKLGVL